MAREMASAREVVILGAKANANECVERAKESARELARENGWAMLRQLV